MFKHLISIAAVAMVSLSGTLPADASELASRPWEDIVAEAKAEGQVVWYQWYTQPKFRELVREFEKAYSIKVTIPDGTPDGNLSKFLAERDRPQGDIDVISIGGDQLPKIDVTAMFAGPLTGLPNYSELRTKINGGDGKGYAVAFWGNQTGLAYDPSRISAAALPQSFAEFTEWIKQNPLDFAFNDPRGGGAGNALIQAVVRVTVANGDLERGNYHAAWDWFTSNKESYGFTASNADSLTRLNGGEFQIVAAWADHLAALQQKGEIDKRMQFYIPRFGMPGGGNVVGIAANAKHKAAALLFIDWLTSAATQKRLHNEMGALSVSGAPTAQQTHSTDWLPVKQTEAIKSEFIKEVVLAH
ncbi:ABC transporter substrate-binding protein [Phyllobacterium endophyticum]|uniref:ABC transporter substrate-binding protein n=1 Tax=Phyllobacterium endophyticum TaxID=1149773 RepID=A0A2P7B1X6_9HYPH|nr:extracellular solute-binding protein [Phyllobacterium endophyticum]MBB3238035.1 putative spermidine/putrescine transport system substrate-binding protein [Phyllobacterium endophyticum]PSH60450.1 ABC transporter substrate-binding protein [Phyllobacterium endophyticum]TYR42628.1 extracellular solute-binding protein [Phyllobacterium endophyticum]